VDLLHNQIVTIVSLPDVRERLATLGFEPVANTPEEFGTWIKSEFVKWREVVRATNIRID
jgi:tripartite-type tricarboxylate transporter receptor subunit TctC